MWWLWSKNPTGPSRLGAVVKKRDFPWIDLGIAAEHFCLQATAEGLGTCMLGWFHEKQVRALLGIPEKSRVGLIITLGYPADPSGQPKTRKKAGEIVCWNAYSEEKNRPDACPMDEGARGASNPVKNGEKES